MQSHLLVPRSIECLDELERQVEVAHSLMTGTLEHLCRGCSEQLLGASAYDALLDLRPRVQEALEALEHLENQRPLADGELALHSAFRMLLRTEM